MRSKIAQKILDETPEELKARVSEYADNLVKGKKPLITLAGTGHRPDKLGGYNKSTSAELENMLTSYLRHREEYKEGRLSIISGMALGFDLALAKAAINLHIPFTAAIPFRGQESVWPKEKQAYYNWILEQAAVKMYVSDPGYAAYKMQKRNEWMVDNCNELVALWKGTPGGTANCVRYAEQTSKPVTNLWDKWQGRVNNTEGKFLNF